MKAVIATPAEGGFDNDNVVGPLSAADTIKLARELKAKA